MTLLVSALTTLLPVPATADTSRTDMPYSYRQQLQEINQQMQRNLGVAEVHPASWLNKEKVASSYLDRARLTGSFSDYLAAKETLDAAFSLSIPTSGPRLTRAKLNYAIHRFSLIDVDLDQAETTLLLNRDERSSIDEIRADVWLNTGKYARAKQAYEQIEAKASSVTSATRLANYYKEIADYAKAEQWLTTAERRNGPRNPLLRSWLRLQRGILDLERGRLSDALAHYKSGLKDFNGYWLLEEHIAEIHALQGDDQLAEQQYRDLIKRTDSPLFMTALADILLERDDNASQSEAQDWLDKTASIYQHRLRTLPELVAGHALDYFLQHGERELAIQIAMNNHGLRPGGESALQLVQAYAINKQTTEAIALLDSIFISPYRSASLHATAATVYQMIDEPELVVQQQHQALAINPLALENIDWLRKKLLTES